MDANATSTCQSKQKICYSELPKPRSLNKLIRDHISEKKPVPTLRNMLAKKTNQTFLIGLAGRNKGRATKKDHK